jgi:hypothetical protein
LSVASGVCGGETMSGVTGQAHGMDAPMTSARSAPL